MSLLLSSCLLLIFPILSVAQVTLTVAAAADLSALQPNLSASFTKTHPEIHLRFVNSASAVLKQQLENGAPYDVYLSANAAFVDQLAKAGKLRPDSVRAYAKGRLGLLWRDGQPHDFKNLGDAGVRHVALPNPKLAPYGVAARQALEHAGIWPAVQPKVVYGENVRQTLQLFESGNADAVLTADSLLAGKHPFLIPDAWHQPILQKAGAVAGSSQREAADTFLNFMTGPAAQKIFAQFGFAAVKLTDEPR